MDWNLAIEKNLEALKRILAMLVAMVEATAGTVADAGAPIGQITLPRHLHRLLLRLLRPTEAATRRLIIIAARGLAVTLPPMRPTKPRRRKPPLNRKNGYGTGIVIRPGPLPQWARDLMPKRSSAPALPLLDPLMRFGTRRRYVKPLVTPRIRSFDDPRIPLFIPRQPEPPPPPSAEDPLDAEGIRRRLGAIGRALDDLPGQANRLARWQARRDARHAAEREGRVMAGASTGGDGARRHHRLSPMRPGRPPGFRKRVTHEVNHVLNELHGLAVLAGRRPDTS